MDINSSTSQIQQEILDQKDLDPTLSASLTSTSLVAEYRLWIRVIAKQIRSLFDIFILFMAEIKALISAQKAHTLKWYETKAKAYQYGYTLVTESDTYSTIDTDAQIVAEAVAVEGINDVVIKVAKLAGDDLAPLDDPAELTPFKTYMNRVKDAGVRLRFISAVADDLKLGLNIYYDPLVLSATGERLDSPGTFPVKATVKTFLRSLVFNNVFVLSRLVTYLEANVEGVRIVDVISATANYGATPYVSVDPKYLPDSGYLRINEAYFDANINYLPQGPIA